MLLALTTARGADVAISALPAASSINAADVGPIVQSGTTKKASFTVQKTYWDTFYQSLDADLTALSALTGTNTIYYRSAASTWTAVTIGTGLSFSSGTLTNTGITSSEISDSAYDSTTWNGVATIGASKNALRDYFILFDTDGDGKVNVLDQGAGLAFTDAGGVLQTPKVIGTDVQAWDTQLQSLAALSYAGNSLKVVRVNSGETDFEVATISTTTTATIGFTSDGAGGVLTTGNKGYFTTAFSGTITGWSITATGSSPTCTIDVWKIGTGTALPTVANTIMGTKPSLSTGNAKRGACPADCSSWTTSFSAGDIFGFNIDAVTVATKITFALEVSH